VKDIAGKVVNQAESDTTRARLILYWTIFKTKFYYYFWSSSIEKIKESFFTVFVMFLPWDYFVVLLASVSLPNFHHLLV